MSLSLQRRQRSIECLSAQTDFRCDVLKLTVERDAATTDARTQPQVLKDAIARAPESGQAHFRLFQLYQSRSLVSNAVAELEQAASCSPLIGLDYLYETLGGLYATQADFDHAAAWYRKRTDVNPNNSEAHRKLGEIYALQGRDDSGLVEFAVAVWLDRKNAEAFAEAGQAYLRANRFADAVRMSQQALALDPMQQKARFTLGTALTALCFPRHDPDPRHRRQPRLTPPPRLREDRKWITRAKSPMAAPLITPA